MRIHSQWKKLFMTVPFSLAIFLLAAVPTSQLRATGNSPLFLPAVTYDSGENGAESLTVADVDLDGKLDVVVANSSSVGVLLGNGDGTFQSTVTYGSKGSFGASVAVADVDGDGKPDVVVANSCASSQCNGALLGSVSVLLGNGDGTFQTAVAYDSGGVNATSVAIADVNGDRKLDLVVTNVCAIDNCPGNGIVGVLLGNGDGTFQPVVTYLSGGSAAASVKVADVNGDGKPDLVVANSFNGVGVLLGNGDGTFQTAVSYESGGNPASSLAVADVNGDGKMDLVLANNCASGSNCPPSDGTVGVLLGNGDGTFKVPTSYDSGGVFASSVAIADVNGDGKSDVLVANFASNTVGVLLGNGDGTFEHAVTYGSGGDGALSVAVADLIKNGKPDLLVASDVGPFANGHGAVGVLLHTVRDTTPPVITLSATPKVLWPPNGKMVPVTVSGTITDTGSGVNVNSAAYAVKDEYGKVQPHGAITLGPGGAYSFTILLQASRLGTDLDGRRYTVTVRARDNAGNGGSKTSVVTVPHDHRD